MNEDQNIIYVDLTVGFRGQVAHFIKKAGATVVQEQMCLNGYHPSFTKVLIKSILRKEGW